MRLIKMFGLASVAAISVVAVVGAISASATSTQLCKVHTALSCGVGNATTSVHTVLAPGTVLKILASISVLCLVDLTDYSVSSLGSPQTLHAISRDTLGCGTSATHNNCTLTPRVLALARLLKTGLDAGVLTLTNGLAALKCSNLGIDCEYDLEGMELEVGGGHFTSNETAITELGGKFFCPNEGLVDGLLERLENTYVLG